MSSPPAPWAVDCYLGQELRGGALTGRVRLKTPGWGAWWQFLLYGRVWSGMLIEWVPAVEFWQHCWDSTACFPLIVSVSSHISSGRKNSRVLVLQVRNWDESARGHNVNKCRDELRARLPVMTTGMMVMMKAEVCWVHPLCWAAQLPITVNEDQVVCLF